MRLWIDDVRPDPDRVWAGISAPEGWTWVQTSHEAIAWLRINQSQTIEVVSFDHDLGYGYLDSCTAIDGGGDPNDEKFSTSRPVLTWMIENNVWPEEIRFHTANPIGREWLVGTATRYAPDTVKVVG